jgi:hypothetical protein
VAASSSSSSSSSSADDRTSEYFLTRTDVTQVNLRQIRAAAGARPGFCSAPMRRPIALAVAIAFFNQGSGINAVLCHLHAITRRENQRTLDWLRSTYVLRYRRCRWLMTRMSRYFAPRIFGLAGLGSSAALLSSAGIGLFNLSATVTGLYLIDSLGRRTLLAVGERQTHRQRF